MRTVCANCKKIIPFRKITDIIKTDRSYCSKDCLFGYLEKRRPPLTLNATCDHCGKPFHRKRTQLEKYKVHFCSMKCSTDSKRKYQVTLVCTECGKPFTRKRSLAAIPTKDVFCSVKHAVRYYSRLWSLTKREEAVCKQWVTSCEVCGWGEFPDLLKVLYRDGKPWNKDEENVVILCPNCYLGVKYDLIKRY